MSSRTCFLHYCAERFSLSLPLSLFSHGLTVRPSTNVNFSNGISCCSTFYIQQPLFCRFYYCPSAHNDECACVQIKFIVPLIYFDNSLNELAASDEEKKKTRLIELKGSKKRRWKIIVGTHRSSSFIDLFWRHINKMKTECKLTGYYRFIIFYIASE